VRALPNSQPLRTPPQPRGSVSAVQLSRARRSVVDASPIHSRVQRGSVAEPSPVQRGSAAEASRGRVTATSMPLQHAGAAHVDASPAASTASSCSGCTVDSDAASNRATASTRAVPVSPVVRSRGLAARVLGLGMARGVRPVSAGPRRSIVPAVQSLRLAAAVT
jgi:hypothetical protein